MARLVTAIVLAGQVLLVRQVPQVLLVRETGEPVEPAEPVEPDEPGKITLARLRWGSDFGGSRRGGFSAAWNHDYPRAEQHLSLITRELTFADIRTDSDIILALDDPKLFDHPIALMWEPGFWNLTDGEAESFRSYLLKGGFAIFEDFDGPQQWSTFEAQMRRVLPDGRLVRLEKTHAIFDSFFRIKDIDAILHPMYGLRPSYLRHLRGERCRAAADGGRQLRQRRPRVLGMVRTGRVPVRHLE